MSSIGNNMSRKAEELRETFFASYDEETRIELLSQPIDNALAKHLETAKASDLYYEAKTLINEVEKGKFNDEEMENVEIIIAHLLAAIVDVQRALIREKTPDFQDDNGLER